MKRSTKKKVFLKCLYLGNTSSPAHSTTSSNGSGLSRRNSLKDITTKSRLVYLFQCIYRCFITCNYQSFFMTHLNSVGYHILFSTDYNNF